MQLDIVSQQMRRSEATCMETRRPETRLFILALYTDMNKIYKMIKRIYILSRYMFVSCNNIMGNKSTYVQYMDARYIHLNVPLNANFAESSDEFDR